MIAHPALVWDVAIGQSTVVTRRVRANLFYRGLVFHRAAAIGDTIRTVTAIVALKQNSARTDDASTGLVALRMTTTDQADRPILDFYRCAMLPLRDPKAQTGHADDMATVGATSAPVPFGDSVAGWNVEPLTATNEIAEGDTIEVIGGDVVSNAPELARLTLNIAIAHHDGGSDGRRLVYGGHTIGLALAQATRALPSLVTVIGWHSCDHLAPVFEGDTLRSVITVEKIEAGGIVHLRSQVAVVAESPRPVLDWRFVGLIA
jgi:acyl dehydratase